MKTFKSFRYAIISEDVGEVRRRITLPGRFSKEDVIDWYKKEVDSEDEQSAGGLSSVPEIRVNDTVLLANKSDAERRTLLAAHHENKAIAMKYRDGKDYKWFIGAWASY